MSTHHSLKLEWQQVAKSENPDSVTSMAKVPGGHLYREIVRYVGWGETDPVSLSVALVFVPDTPQLVQAVEA